MLKIGDGERDRSASSVYGGMQRDLHAEHQRQREGSVSFQHARREGCSGTYILNIKEGGRDWSVFSI
jgi:hypothetical protein